jgi:RimJ/RimL family protein N-acetyltransferase
MEVATTLLNDYELKRLKAIMPIFPSTREQVEEMFLDHFTKHTESRYGFAITTREEQRYIGWCGYMDRNSVHNTVEVAIAITDREYWGKGYGTDALRVLICFLFHELNVRKIMLTVHGYNERAIRCYKRIGFQEEGCLRKHRYYGGEYCDDIIMGLFREEYIETHVN